MLLLLDVEFLTWLAVVPRDLVSLLAVKDVPRLFTQNEDQNLGIWLQPFRIRPIHDRRIQQAHVCENDMIAKHFSQQYAEDLDQTDMYQNVVKGLPMCRGFRQQYCALCYPSCRARSNHWRDWGFECDNLKGITLLNPSPASRSWLPVGDEPILEEPINLASDAISTSDTLTRIASRFSGTSEWHLMHMVCWTTDQSTFQERHYQTLETVFVHQPRASIVVLSPTLPESFFESYRQHGYDIHVVRTDRTSLLEGGWFLGPSSRQWLLDWDRWASGPFFFSHLTDYLRFVFLYRYGGTYMDMDAPWVRTPPEASVEFIGADYSTLATDTEWTLDEDGMYLAPGVMRFRRGWTMFRDILETAFGPSYSPSCFNCVGPRAITSYVKPRRRRFETYGLRILPREILYPKNWLDAPQLLAAKSPPEAMAALQAIVGTSWSIHLFGKMTNHIEIDPSSVAALALDSFGLEIPRGPALLSTSSKRMGKDLRSPRGIELRYPNTYRYKTCQVTYGNRRDQDAPSCQDGSLEGTFQGLDAIFIRGVHHPRVASARLTFKTKSGTLQWSAPGTVRARPSRTYRDGTQVTIDLPDATLQDVNLHLSSFVYVPGTLTDALRDEISLQVTFGREKVQGAVLIIGRGQG